MTSSSATVSVVIITHNAGPEFPELLRRVTAQAGDFSPEIIVVDSESSDGTDRVARDRGAKLTRISKTEFDHGATRNLGIALSSGRYVALLVQDALPLDEHWLAAMVEHLDRDDRVAGVYGRQLPRPECDEWTRALVNSRATAHPDRRVQVLEDPARLSSLPPVQRRRLAAFDNVSSCVRRSVWEEIPFEATRFGEDLRWGKRVVEAGYELVYEPRSAVFHSHQRGASYDLRRHYIDQRLLGELFDNRAAPSTARLIPRTLAASRRHYRALRAEVDSRPERARLALLALRRSVPIQLGLYAAGLGQALERRSPRAARRLDGFMSGGV